MTDFRDPFDSIKDHPFDAALSQRYLVYALSTITARSLPDLRDGLKHMTGEPAAQRHERERRASSDDAPTAKAHASGPGGG
mgnify:CR=1 FL=1